MFKISYGFFWYAINVETETETHITPGKIFCLDSKQEKI